MTQEPELKAMIEIYNALKDLDRETQYRIIKWLEGKLGVSPSPRKIDAPLVADVKVTEISNLDSVADLFSKASPKTESDKVLLVASYLQERNKAQELTGREINKELHHLGHRIKNITSAIDVLIKRKPQLMIQTKKEGKSQQAQKKYKVTTEGLKAAQEMFSSNEIDD